MWNMRNLKCLKGNPLLRLAIPSHSNSSLFAFYGFCGYLLEITTEN